MAEQQIHAVGDETARGVMSCVQHEDGVVQNLELAQAFPLLAGFDERPQQSQSWEQLRERLRARLGDSAVHGLGDRPDHRPERSWIQEAIGLPLSVCGPRPGWLVAEPYPLYDSSLRIVSGPERIESGWWDGGDVRRDYYVVETRSGQRGWAFRFTGTTGPLMLHGWFA